MSLLLQYLHLTYLRITGPIRRFAVVLRYEGATASLSAIRERLKGNSASAGQSPALAIPVSPPLSQQRTVEGPLVSVVVRTYNRPNLLKSALADLARQTYRSIEVLIVNDGDASILEVVRPFASDSKVRIVAHRPGTGRSAALNSGLLEARGELVTYLDDDDRVFPHHIATLVSGFRDDVDVVYTLATRVLCWSDLTEDRPLEMLPCVSREFDQYALLVDNWIPLMTFMHRKSCLETAGRFDPELRLFEDWDFLIRLGRICHFRHLPIITCEYRYRFGPITEQARSALRERALVLEATEVIYRRYPVLGAESHARRSLTLQALKRDICEVAWIQQATNDALLRDLRTVAWVGRFPNPQRHIAALSGPRARGGA